jgi:hypothetical protein
VADLQEERQDRRDTKEKRMSDQVFDDPEGTSIESDRDAAADSAEDDEGFAPADHAGSVLADPDLDKGEPTTSYGADVAAGLDDEE